jgi:hypothetical protein
MGHLSQKVVTQISCPIDWESKGIDSELSYWLRFIWFAVVKEYQVDGESSLLDWNGWSPDADEIELLDVDESNSVLKRIESWKPCAITRYQRLCGRFAELRVLDPESHNHKHSAHPSATDSEVASLSFTSGEGVLYPRITLQFQTELMWEALLKLRIKQDCVFWPDIDDRSGAIVSHFEYIFGCNVLHLAVDLCIPVGCTHGKASQHLMLKFGFTSPERMHPHPISAAEYATAEYAVEVPYFDLPSGGLAKSEP